MKNRFIGFYNAETGETVYIAENIVAVIVAIGKSMESYANVQRYISRAASDQNKTFNFNGIRCHVKYVSVRESDYETKRECNDHRKPFHRPRW